VHLVIVALLVTLEYVVHLVSWDLVVNLVSRVKVVLKVRWAHKVSLVFLEALGRLVRTDHMVRRAQLDQLVSVVQ